MAGALKLPIIDLSADDTTSTANSVLQACTEIGFFYVINHGVDKDMFEKFFCQSKSFFSLPVEEKLKLRRKEHRGYSPFHSDMRETADSREEFRIGPLEDEAVSHMNQWTSKDALPAYRETMEAYCKQILLAGKKLLSLIALALDLDENFFTETSPSPFLLLLHYQGELRNGELFGVSPHTDFGMITLLATDGGPGLQVCREKDRQPPIWEDVPRIDGAIIVNIGDMLERWTNCRFRSTLHRVVPTGQERYSAAFFLNPNNDCVVECLKSCCSEYSPPKFPPIRSWDYIKQRLKDIYI